MNRTIHSLSYRELLSFNEVHTQYPYKVNIAVGIHCHIVVRSFLCEKILSIFNFLIFCFFSVSLYWNGTFSGKKRTNGVVWEVTRFEHVKFPFIVSPKEKQLFNWTRIIKWFTQRSIKQYLIRTLHLKCFGVLKTILLSDLLLYDSKGPTI